MLTKSLLVPHYATVSVLVGPSSYSIAQLGLATAIVQLGQVFEGRYSWGREEGKTKMHEGQINIVWLLDRKKRRKQENYACLGGFQVGEK